MTKFKVGDKVRIRSDLEGGSFLEKQGKIVECLDSPWPYTVNVKSGGFDTHWSETELELVK